MQVLGRTKNGMSGSAAIEAPSVWLVMDLEAKKRGSLEEQLLALGRRLTRARVATTFVFSSEPPAWMIGEFSDCGVDLRWIDFRKGPEAFFNLAANLRQARPSIVHFHFVRAYSPLVAAARAAGARVLLHDHMALGVTFIDVPERSRTAQSAITSWKRARAAMLNRLVDKRIAVSRFVADSIERTEFVPARQIAVLEHGIDIARYANASQSKLRQEIGVHSRPLIACVSRMSPEKGVDILIRAHAKVGRDAVLVVAGDGPDRDKCQALANDLHIGDRVHFLGLRKDVDCVLAGCDVAVVPSSAPEAFGLCVVEAMAAGKPVVVTDAGAMPEIVDHGRCGTVVPKRDVDALAGALGGLIDGPVFAKMLGDAGRQRATERYGLGAWVERLANIYAETIPALTMPIEDGRRAVA